MDRAWKQQERLVAKALGSHRNPNNGTAQSDIDAGVFVIEHKARKSLPSWLTGALQQATDAAEPWQTPIVVLSEVRQGVKAKRYVLLSFESWLEWHGENDDG